MKKLVLIGITAMTLSTINTAYAGFSFHLANADSCQTISGQWIGSGKASNWFIGDCIYHGTGTASTLDSQGHFTLSVVAQKDSGHFFCPEQSTKALSGVCANGEVVFNTEYGALKGSFANNVGQAHGTLTASPGIDVEVAIEFRHVG